TWKNFLKAVKETVRLTCFVYLLIAGASIYGKFFTLTNIPVNLGGWLEANGFSPFVILLMIAIIYFVLSFVVDAQALVLLTIPIFYPIVIQQGFDGIWFGAFTVVVVGIGDITPPVSLLIYVMHGVAKRQAPLMEIFIGVCPFMFTGFIMLILLIIFPQLATFIPDLMGK
ncbi:MAG: TRAP transporter large permease subunit, partial [Clostridiales Family XIII bacterium]|nr:TRAP transporter large permease subunit [Clostridiales Family XIII bacterium]